MAETSAGLLKAGTSMSSKPQGPAHSLFSTAWSYASFLELWYHVSLFLSRSIRSTQPQSFGTSRSSAQACFLCLNSSPDFLFKIPQTYPFRAFPPSCYICTACSSLMLCFTHICVILISPARLHLNTSLSSQWWLCGCFLHLSQARFLSPPAFSLLRLESIITKCVILTFFSFEIIHIYIYIVFCRYLKMFLLLISCVYWH